MSEHWHRCAVNTTSTESREYLACILFTIRLWCYRNLLNVDEVSSKNCLQSGICIFKALWMANAVVTSKANLLIPEDVALILSNFGVDMSGDGKVTIVVRTDRQTDACIYIYICDCILENRPFCHISYFEKYRF